VRWLLVLLLVVGCGGGQKPEEAPPPSCSQVADGMLSNLRATQEQHAPQETADMIKEIIHTACDRDHWSDPARRCLAQMKPTAEDADRCTQELTQDQLDALSRDEKAKIPPH